MLNDHGAKTSNLRFMQGLIPALGTNRGVECVTAVTAYQARIDPSLTQPSSQAPLPVTHAPSGPTLPASGCNGLSWPQPIPADLIGAPASQALIDALGCFNVTAIAPDGHDILNDKANDITPWVIKSVSPPSGTPVGKDGLITLRVAL